MYKLEDLQLLLASWRQELKTDEYRMQRLAERAIKIINIEIARST